MVRNQSASSMRSRRPARNVRHISDDKIDFSDIPESTDTELARARRVGRPRTGRAKTINSCSYRSRGVDEAAKARREEASAISNRAA